ncbi:uncharacterized protein LOC135350820 isoform X3 [Halichondria panicea]|uniref:uncharacterized protein LOC135350820 isoform X3 n=1 Tax=Halichondria panicea TaxID=6063 RepID=UPI00312B3DCB
MDTILQLVPTAPSVLMPLLIKNYPFKGRGPDIQEVALKNVLYLTTYCPALRDGVWELIFPSDALYRFVTPEVKVQQQEQANLLDCYFPFDPYCLKRSSLYVQSLYQEWEEMEIAGLEDDHSSMASSFPNSLPMTTSLDSSLPYSVSPS